MAEGQPWQEPRPLAYSRWGTLTEVPPASRPGIQLRWGRCFRAQGKCVASSPAHSSRWLSGLQICPSPSLRPLEAHFLLWGFRPQAGRFLPPAALSSGKFPETPTLAGSGRHCLVSQARGISLPLPLAPPG